MREATEFSYGPLDRLVVVIAGEKREYLLIFL
jgi:hypothetical protein